jgi:hypothetical protein
MVNVADAEYAALQKSLDALRAALPPWDAAVTNLRRAVSDVLAADLALDAAKPPVVTPPPTTTPPPTVTPPPVLTTTARFFSAESPWNQRDDPTWVADAKSDLMIANLAADMARVGKGFLVNGTDNYPFYAIPIYAATASTPKVAVSPAPRNWWKGFAAVPIPANAVPAQGSDKHLTIEDADWLWEFWEMQKDSGGRWSAGSGSQMPKRGNGYSDRAAGLASRAYGGSSTAGSILKKEMQDGLIPHCLALAYETVLGPAYARGQVAGGPMAIGSHSDNYQDAAHSGPGCIPEGARLRIKKGTDIVTLAGGKRDALIVLTALRDYGGFMVDHAGAPSVYAEALTDGSSWGTLLGSRAIIDVSATVFEVLRLPALTPMA